MPKWVLSALLLFSLNGIGQTVTYTPNLNLAQPPHGWPNWDQLTNQNWSVLDTAVGNLQKAWKGAWSGANTYQLANIVSYNGMSYYSLIANNTGQTPNTSASAWALIGVLTTGGGYPAAGVAVSTGTAWGTSIPQASIPLITGTAPAVGHVATWADATHLQDGGTLTGGGGMVYPAVGVPVSTGTAWGTSIPQASLAVITGTPTAGHMTTWTDSQHVQDGGVIPSMVYPAAGVPVSTGTAWTIPIPQASIPLITGTAPVAGHLTVWTDATHIQDGGATSTNIANVTTTVGAQTINANTCTTATTVTMTGVTTASSFSFTPNSDVSGVTGWGATGGLVFDDWPTANTLTYKVCNQSATNITTSAPVTFNVSAK